ncbi:MAG: hypothetical protein A2X12_07975 [Bacteroidetes bacterium GWE2_29_8]|nr:MAG: hypothetical protein A2X12_07975 [Bacteroidetes bacterium GWE2_29_8]OFY16183.1 MAG: hypothetical protein A2X02_07215 [Bacteroidetes bacterium GWF2_29_10]
MRTINAILGVMFLFSIIGAQAQDQPSTAAENPNAPVVQFEKMVHDYGTIKKNSDGTCEFVFKNTGKEPLILSNVKTSCGCTTPYWPHEPIMPGKTEKIKIQYATGRVGPINKTITVFSNAKNDAIVLSIKGLVEDVAEPEQK